MPESKKYGSPATTKPTPKPQEAEKPEVKVTPVTPLTPPKPSPVPDEPSTEVVILAKIESLIEDLTTLGTAPAVLAIGKLKGAIEKLR